MTLLNLPNLDVSARITHAIPRKNVEVSKISKTIRTKRNRVSYKSIFASDRTASPKKRIARPEENLCSSPVKHMTIPFLRLARPLRNSMKMVNASLSRGLVLDNDGQGGICSNVCKL